MIPILTSSIPPRASHRYHVETERSMLIEEYEGRVGLENLRDAASAIAADPAQKGNHRLVDLTKAELSLSSDEVLRCALLWRSDKSRPGGWHAFAVNDSAAFSAVRMLSYWARVSDRCRIFPNREDAERWLVLNTRPQAS